MSEKFWMGFYAFTATLGAVNAVWQILAGDMADAMTFLSGACGWAVAAMLQAEKA